MLVIVCMEREEVQLYNERPGVLNNKVANGRRGQAAEGYQTIYRWSSQKVGMNMSTTQNHPLLSYKRFLLNKKEPEATTWKQSVLNCHGNVETV